MTMGQCNEERRLARKYIPIKLLGDSGWDFRKTDNTKKKLLVVTTGGGNYSRGK